MHTSSLIQHGTKKLDEPSAVPKPGQLDESRLAFKYTHLSVRIIEPNPEVSFSDEVCIVNVMSIIMKCYVS
jgi:hypothetical protein